MSFTAGLRCDDVHVEVRKQLMQDQVFHPLRTELERNGQANGERKLEDMIHRILKEKSGPTTVLEVFFTDGSAIKFFKQMDAIDKHENFESFLSEKLRNLELLDNRDNRYYIGTLRNQAGNFSTRKLNLTADGKMQLFLNGNGPLEVAMRNAVGKPWLEKLVHLENEVRRQRMEYNKEHAQKRALSTEYFNDQLQCMMGQGISESVARMKLRNHARYTYQALLPVFKSGTDAVLCAQDDKLSVQDALLCAQGRDDEVSIGPVELKKRRATVKNVTDRGTQIFHSRQADIRYQEHLLMTQGVDALEAAKIVAQQSKDSGCYVFKDRDGAPLPPKEQADLYFNKNKDLAVWKQMSVMAQMQPLALPPTPARAFPQQESPPPPPPQQSEGGSGRILQHMQVTGVKRRLAVSDRTQTDDPFDASNIEGPSSSEPLAGPSSSGAPGIRRYKNRT